MLTSNSSTSIHDIESHLSKLHHVPSQQSIHIHTNDSNDDDGNNCDDKNDDDVEIHEQPIYNFNASTHPYQHNVSDHQNSMSEEEENVSEEDASHNVSEHDNHISEENDNHNVSEYNNHQVSEEDDNHMSEEDDNHNVSEHQHKMPIDDIMMSEDDIIAFGNDAYQVSIKYRVY